MNCERKKKHTAILIEWCIESRDMIDNVGK